MAKYKNGINGVFSGKVGPVTGSSWLGTPYMKGNNRVAAGAEPSVGQLNQRMVFAMVSSWLKPMKRWIEMGYGNVEGQLPMNAAISFVLKQAVLGLAPNYEIDYPQMVWSRGALLMSLVTKFVLLEGGSIGASGVSTLRIEWENALPSFYNAANDEAVFIFYNPVQAAFAVFDGQAVRADGFVELDVSFGVEGGIVHGWMFYTREGMRSTSIYIGAV